MKLMMLKASAVLLAVTSGLIVPGVASAQSNPWLVRLRAVNLDSANKDSTGLDLSINDKVYPEVDASYFFSPELAAELSLTYPQKHDSRSSGVNIGTLKHMPTTLTLQYHFTQMGAFKPYVGAGINYTRFSSVQFDPAIQSALNPSLDKNSWGLAAQVGFDYAISKNTYFNVDIKKVQIQTDVTMLGVNLGKFKVDPWLVGVGVGWKF